MFATHPSLAYHFEPPTFSPGVPSRELRNRVTFLMHCRAAGLIPEVEWEAITRALAERRRRTGDDDDGGIVVVAPRKDSDIGVVAESKTTDDGGDYDDATHNGVVDPFRYVATETPIRPREDDAREGGFAEREEKKEKEEKKKEKKKKHWTEYETTSLVPISPHRRGSAEDVALPYSVEIWRKAKTLNRDRSVLACALAHLSAMRTLVGEGGVGEDGGGGALEDGGDDDDGGGGGGGFDFILEDNVRAFAGVVDDDDGVCPEEEGTTSSSGGGWSCECAGRIWDIIEASGEAPYDCHMRYYGWLGSLPNVAWMYNNHVPRSAFVDVAATRNDDDASSRECAVVFPLPTNEDFEVDSIVVATTSESKRGDAERAGRGGSSGDDDDGRYARASSSAPHFTTPGGTAAVWGAFAYTISPSAYRTLIDRLRNDVGALMWKGKRMRAYRAKPIDKILPRHVAATFGSKSVHVPNKVAFVRCPMLGSLLHQHWEAGFCSSTELQYHLSRGVKGANHPTSPNPVDGSDVWKHVWLAKEERQIVNHRIKTGQWVHNCDDEQMVKEDANCSKLLKAISLAVIVCVQSSLSVLAFSSNTPFHNRFERTNYEMMSSKGPDDGTNIDTERKRGKIGGVPIISRTISIDVKVPLELPGKKVYSDGHEIKSLDDIKRLDVTVWEMDKPSDLIQEWWSLDQSERNARVGDPFGVVMWPGSILAAKELMKLHHSAQFISPMVNATVLVLGAGTGVEAQTAALLGAKRVIATDINPLTLKLLEYGANNDLRIGNNFKCKYFDLFSDQSLPACDVLIAADVLYNPELAKQVGRRLHEAIVRSFDAGSSPTKVIITDSQQFHGTNFLEKVTELRELNAMFKESNFEQLRWETQKLESVQGSGVLIDEDQTYDVDARMISWGW
ncbi:hypothetical protein ACHAW5_000696 [Stephanodiscus triporus]|uniref:Uncharacterized protein n=1 Tax=Stephanodiscus triporus TaxID=2934178 RepID=A0ABD3P1D0_9STRA